MKNKKEIADILGGGVCLQGVLVSKDSKYPEKWFKEKGFKFSDGVVAESKEKSGVLYPQEDVKNFERGSLKFIDLEDGISLVVGKKLDGVISVPERREKLALVKSIDINKKSVTAYVSTQQWDRYDERFARGAWDLEDFKKNPVVMWAHDYKQPPIGKAVNISEDDNGLLSESVFDEKSEFAMHVFSLYERGFMNAFSVGFNPREWMMENIDPERKGIVYTNASLLEYSAVPIPANPGALVPKSVGEVCRTLGLKEVTQIAEDIYLWGTKDNSPKKEDHVLKKFDKTALKYINQMARTAKGNPVGEDMVSLMQTTIDTFQDIINDNVETVSKKEVEALSEQVKALGEIVKNMNPDAEDVVADVLRTIDAGVKNL